MAFAIAVLVGLGALALRLAYGPLSVGLITPIVEAAFNGGMTEHQVAIEDAILRWSRKDHLLELRFVDVRLKNSTGTIIAEVPEMEATFSASALLHGVIAPAEIAIFHPAATVLRRPDGRFQLGFSGSGNETLAQGTDHFFDMLLSILRGEPGAAGKLGHLKRFTIRDATLTFFDSATGSLWQAPRGLLTFARGATGLEASLQAQVMGASGTFSISAKGVLERASDLFHLTASVKGFNPQIISSASPAFASLSGVALPLEGTLSLTLNGAGVVKEGQFAFRSGAGRFIMPGLTAMAFDVKRAEAKGYYDAAAKRVVLEKLFYDAGPNRALVTGSMTPEIGEKGALKGLLFDLAARDVALNLPKMFALPGKMEEVTLEGRLDLTERRIAIDQALLKSGPAKIAVRGVITDGPETPDVKLTGTIESLPLRDFAKLWPIGSAEGARDWVVNNITAGMITEGALVINAPAGALAHEKLAEEIVRLDFSYSNLQVNYIQGLTPITDAAGHAILQGNTFKLWMDQGRIGPLAVKDSTFTVEDLSTRGSAGVVSIGVVGPTSAFLNVLDMQPLGYPTRFGIEANSVGGTISTQLRVEIPLRRDVSFAEMTLGATGVLQEFALPALYRDFALSNGSLKLAVNKDRLTADGNAIVGGYPAKIRWTEDFAAQAKTSTNIALDVSLDESGRKRAFVSLDDFINGQTPLHLVLTGNGVRAQQLSMDADLTQSRFAIPDLSYAKPRGAKAALRLTLDFANESTYAFHNIVLAGPGLNVKGALKVDDRGRILSGSFNPFRVGPQTDVMLTAGQDQKGALLLDVKGKSLDVGAAVSRFTKDWRDGSGSDRGLVVEAALDQVGLANDVSLSNVSFRYAENENRLEDLRLNAVTQQKQTIESSLERGVGGTRHLTVKSDDGGALLRGLSITTNITGGKFDLEASLPISAADSGSGTLRLRNFRVKKAPALTKLLAFASFGTLGDMLNGDGISFENLEVPFTLEPDRVAVARAHAYGPAIGITLEGKLPRGEGDVDLDGTLVPAYTLNRVLGYVPVFGKIFTSRSNEGVIGMTYSVSGDPSDPHVSVNPLSMVAPGFLRRLFQIGEPKSAQTKPAHSSVVPD